MKRVVLALVGNERYFPGLCCAVASSLNQLDATREVDLKVLDGGISQASTKILSELVKDFGRSAQVELLPIDESIFRRAALGPGSTHMAYCRILLPQLLDVPRAIYLDCDALVFRDLSELFDFELPAGKILAAVPDSETLTLGGDCRSLADAMNLPNDGRYFNSGVMLLNLDELRKQNFAGQSFEFFKNCREQYRFHDQSAINFLLHGQIAELPEYWNRPSWRFDAQQNNDLNCLLHYTTSAPWLGGTRGPAQVLFERFAAEAGFPINPQSLDFKKSARRNFWRNALAPARALTFPIEALLHRIAGKTGKSAAYQKVGRYWLDYIRNAPMRRRLYRRRNEEISKMKFDLRASQVAS